MGAPQLLVYIASVYKARARDRINKSVFRIVSDSKEFRFCFLDEKKKFFTTKSFTWIFHQSTLIGYIDMILNIAIESPPHTTPRNKTKTKIIRKYPEYLGRKWTFEIEGAENKEEEEDDDMVDVLKTGGRVVLRTTIRCRGRPSSPEDTYDSKFNPDKARDYFVVYACRFSVAPSSWRVFSP